MFTCTNINSHTIMRLTKLGLEKFSGKKLVYTNVINKSLGIS